MKKPDRSKKTSRQAKKKTLHLNKTTVKDLESKDQDIKAGGFPRPSTCAPGTPTYMP